MSGANPRHRARQVVGPWAQQAACRGTDPNLFLPVKTAPRTVTDKAKAVCAGCAVRDACLEHAVAEDEPGIWGGTTHKERRRIAVGLDPATRTGTCTRCGCTWTLTSTSGRIAKVCPDCRYGDRKGAA